MERRKGKNVIRTCTSALTQSSNNLSVQNFLYDFNILFINFTSKDLFQKNFFLYCSLWNVCLGVEWSHLCSRRWSKHASDMLEVCAISSSSSSYETFPEKLNWLCMSPHTSQVKPPLVVWHFALSYQPFQNNPRGTRFWTVTRMCIFIQHKHTVCTYGNCPTVLSE